MSAPERIWLQDGGDYDHAAQFEVTWCAEPQDDADTEYIRADLVQALVAEAMKRALYATRDRTWSGVEALISNPAALSAIGEGGE